MNKNNPAKIYIPRSVEKEITPFLDRKEVIGIVGSRQVGKTTLLKRVKSFLESENKSVKFLTFEKSGDLSLFQDDIEDFKKVAKGYDCVIIDEFQYAREGGKKLKYLYDTTDTKFIISGSSSLELTFSTGKYMVGRLLSFELYPVSFREFLYVRDNELYNLLQDNLSGDILEFDIREGFGATINKKLSAYLEEYSIFGGYPEVVLSREEKVKRKLLEGIVDTYLLKDIKGLLHLAGEDKLIKLSKFLAAQAGNLVKYEEIANSADLNYPETKKNLNILDNTFIIDFLSPYYTNKRLELSKNKKVYFIDTGFRNFLLSDFRKIEDRQDAGNIVENLVYLQLKRTDHFNSLKYWRTKSKAEVDFVLENKGEVIPVEVKYSSKRAVGKSFYSFLDKFKPSQGIILTKDYLKEERIGKTKVKFIPISYL
jgi:hypothetical protein